MYKYRNKNTCEYNPGLELGGKSKDKLDFAPISANTKNKEIQKADIMGNTAKT
jgi:hypothetical protein